MLRLHQTCVVAFLLGSALPVAGEDADVTTYTGCCDASAAVAVDERHFVIADDEDNILRVYERAGGAPVMQIDLNSYLGGTKKTEEADLEGGAMVDDIIYWIGSHGRNAKGKDSPMRQRIIATRVDHEGGLQIEPVSKPYTKLLEDLLADDRLKQFGLEQAATKAPKSEGALNIEGLTSTPDGQLLIGFRNPIRDGKALIVPLLNPRQLFEGDRAQFGDPVALDLNGLGIRSIGYHDGRCLIIAGHYASGGNSRVYEWKPGEPNARLLEHIRLRGLNPEGMSFVGADGKREFLVVSDDGTRTVNGQECKTLKDPAQKRFRGIVLKL
jgi:Protein of unknown function (DUF3616)